MKKIILSLVLFFGLIGISQASYYGDINITDRNIPGSNARLDASTEALEFIDYEHHEVHSGSHYNFHIYDQDLDSGATMQYIITTVNSAEWVHLVWSAIGSLTTLVELFEDPTHTIGASQNYYNNNRNSGNGGNTVISAITADAANGTLIDCVSFGLSTGQGISTKSAGGTSRGGQEWVLQQDTKYLIRVVSLADNNNVSLRLNWYEHTDKN